MLTLPDALTPDDFLARHWQKAPLFLPQALPAGLPQLTADEVAWLATQDDVESRLVLTAGHRYQLTHGPFTEDELRVLPARDWTLLVQDVDKHLPDFRAWFAAVPFIPDWRIDDLMVSCAAPGGGVGPHRDNYDVFLCQGQGRREWRLADAKASRRDTTGTELSLIEPFTDPHAVLALPGDVLYLPPGIGHWGTAASLCVTYSIGMRAPTRSEFALGVERELCRSVLHNAAPQRFYRDADLNAGEAEAGRISTRALARARACLAADDGLSDDELARVLVAVVTDPKAWLEPERTPADVCAAYLAAAGELPVHGMARLAWTDNGWAGINGHARPLDTASLRFFRDMCRRRRARPAQCPDTTVRDWLLAHAVFTDAGG
ncbi:MAG TPA: cupin domain-containing protein [Woeseiaceae bacterium]|nr:cupin domain-containing protein [Woeseiaceae bacterium]